MKRRSDAEFRQRPGHRVRSFAATALALPALLALGGCAADQPHATTFGSQAMMRDGGTVVPPPGWLEYCGRNPDDISCRAAQLTPARWQQLQAVQVAIQALPRQTDESLFHQADYWAAADVHGGDCEDLALAARAMLMKLGWPASSLRLATAWTEQQEYHLVLTVDIAAADKVATVVLDSRFPAIKSWEQLARIGYRFNSRQASHGATWVKIESGPHAPSRDPLPVTQVMASITPAAAVATAQARDVQLTTAAVAPPAPPAFRNAALFAALTKTPLPALVALPVATAVTRYALAMARPEMMFSARAAQLAAFDRFGQAWRQTLGHAPILVAPAAAAWPVPAVRRMLVYPMAARGWSAWPSASNGSLLLR